MVISQTINSNVEITDRMCDIDFLPDQTRQEDWTDVKLDVKMSLNDICYLLIIVHAFAAAIFTFAKRHDFKYELTICEKSLVFTE